MAQSRHNLGTISATSRHNVQAEVVNGRLAMAAITISVALSADPTLKALVAMYKASPLSE